MAQALKKGRSGQRGIKNADRVNDTEMFCSEYKDENGKVTPTLYSSYTMEQLETIKSVEVDKIKVKGKDELITIYKPVSE